MNPIDADERPKLELLLLCDYEAGTAGTIVDHIFGIKQFSRHTIRVLSSRGEFPTGLELGRFDGLIIHYSLVACLDAFIGPRARQRIKQFPGVKIAFVQDDYRFIDQTVDAMRDLGVNVLFGLAPDNIIDDVYPPSRLEGVIRETVLTGYVPEHLTKMTVPPFSERKIDIGYRARKLPAWLGALGQQKWIIADVFKERAGQYNLKCDISTNEYDRIYGRDWIDFVANCKSMIGSESGSSVCDFTGEIQKRVEQHERAFPGTPFDVLRDLYFKDEDGRLPMNVISPRCFEAAALRTLMILYDGKYSNRLVPWRHYVPLRLDHSNFDEVVGVLQNPERAQGIIDTAFNEVALNPENMFPSMVVQMDSAIDRAFRESMSAAMPYYTSSAFEIIRRRAKLKAFLQKVLRRRFAQGAAMATDLITALPPDLRAKVEPKYHWIRHAINTHLVKGRF
jgi:hypothetical protein